MPEQDAVDIFTSKPVRTVRELRDILNSIREDMLDMIVTVDYGGGDSGLRFITYGGGGIHLSSTNGTWITTEGTESETKRRYPALADRLSKEMDRLGVSIRELAAVSPNKSYESARKVLAGEVLPKDETLRAYCDHLELDFNEMVALRERCREEGR
jgi:hypothetical protein